YIVAGHTGQFGSDDHTIVAEPILIGGKSRPVAKPAAENNRFISLCMRRSSVKGSKPIRGKSESAMVLASLHVYPGDAHWSDSPHPGKSLELHAGADCNCREVARKSRFG